MMISLETHKHSLIAGSTSPGLEGAKQAFGVMMEPWVKKNIDDWCLANSGHRLIPVFQYLKCHLIEVLTGSLDYFMGTLNPTLRIMFRVQNFDSDTNGLILKTLGYKKFRNNSLSHKWAESLGVRTCVYCNASYALKLGKSHRNRLKFTIDHFLPESVFPHLCLSFFNMVPCCSNCNTVKSKRVPRYHIHYHPFRHALDDFAVFRLDYTSISDFLLSGDENDLNIQLDLRSGMNPTVYLPVIGEYDAFFDVRGLYDLFKIEAAALITKLIHYDQTRMVSLGGLQIGAHDIGSRLDRYLKGEYTVKEDVLMRPLSKFYLDIQQDAALRRIIQSIQHR